MASESFPSSFDDHQDPEENQNVIDKFIAKSKQQPLVPLGVLATIGAVGMAARGLKRGDKHDANRWFRWRVVFQGLTLVALVGGSFVYDRAKFNQKSDEELAREKAKVREQLWINELERRDEEIKMRKMRAEMARKAKEEAGKNF